MHKNAKAFWVIRLGIILSRIIVGGLYTVVGGLDVVHEEYMNTIKSGAGHLFRSKSESASATTGLQS